MNKIFYTLDLKSQKKKLPQKFVLQELPENISVNIGKENEDEKLYVYFPNFRRKRDREIKNKYDLAFPVWLVALINDKYYLSDASYTIAWHLTKTKGDKNDNSI